MKQNILASAMIAAGLLMSPLAHATNGYFPIGYGAKNESMGGASIALPQDAIAAANNPAGMVMVGDRVDFEVTWFHPNRSANIAGNTLPGPPATPGTSMNGTYSGNGKSNFFIPDFGYNKMLNPDSSIGVSVFGNGGMNTQYNTNPFAAAGGSGAAGIDLAQLFIAPTFSVKVTPTNSIGIAVNLAYQQFSATGLQPFAGMSATPGSVTNNGTDTSTGYGLRVGWIGQVSPDVTLGATYQTKTKMSKFSKYAGLFANGGEFDVPANYGAGIAVKATPSMTVAFDAVRILYSTVPAVGDPLSLPPPYGTGPQFGSTNGPGFGWQNMTVYKLGFAYVVDPTLTLRAGFNHNTQQIPPAAASVNILAPGVVQNHLTLGSTWTFADKSELTIAYVHAFRNTVTGRIPAGMGSGNATISMFEDSVGIQYGW